MIAEARRHEELETENAQRTKELETARQLQLSMLPQSLPVVLHLEIAVYMKTATEIGSDYYDFALSRDDVLTLAIGDRNLTQSGYVVTVTKRLFHAHDASLAEACSFFRACSSR